MTVVYYRAHDVLVTREAFILYLPAPARFAIRDLRGVTMSRRRGGWLGWRPVWELHASYRGSDITLYRTRDRMLIARMHRAVRRALESQVASDLPLPPLEHFAPEPLSSQDLDEATDTVNEVLNLLGPPPDMPALPSDASPLRPVGAS